MTDRSAGRAADPPPPPAVEPPALVPPAPPASPVPPPPAPAAGEFSEDAAGRVYKRGIAEPLGQLTAWRNSMSAKCKLHAGKCVRVYTIAALPSNATLTAWLAEGLDRQKCPDAQRHMGLPRE